MFNLQHLKPFNCWQLIICSSLIIDHYILLRSGQVGVPAGSRKPGNLPESLWPDRALLQHWRRGPVSGSRRRSAAAAVPLPAVRGPDGRLPAIMLNPSLPPCSTFILTSAHFSHSLPTATIKGCDKPSAPLVPFSPSHRQRGWFNHYHDYEKCNIYASTCACARTYVQRGSS